MPFIGNQPALSYTSFAKQDFTTSATTSYTLDNPVANANELALFINFVRQEPTTAYSASGTSLTLTSATSATDDMYCVFLGKAVQTVNPPNGSVGASQIVDSSIALGKLSATGTKDATTFLRGDNTFAEAGGGVNTPAFEAYLGTSGGQTLTNNTVTAININTEVFDTASAFDTSTYRFTIPSGQAGKYFIYGNIQYDSTTDGALANAYCYIYVNGSGIAENNYDLANNYGRMVQVGWHGVLDLSVGDYVQLYGRIGSTNGTIVEGHPQWKRATHFGGYKIIE
jgi:hypothetical protein